MKRLITIVSVVLIIVALTFGFMYKVVDKFESLDKDKAERYFNKDKEDILRITQYYIDSGYSDIFINDSSGRMHKGTIALDITDESVKKAVNRLMDKRGYLYIQRTDNTISFTIWSRGSDEGRGLAYSIDHEHKPILEYLTALEPLEEVGWYYYEEDFNEWRVRYK